MKRRIISSFSLILTICLIVAFSAGDSIAATEFRVKALSVAAGSPQRDYAEGEIIVKFRKGVDSREASRLLLAQGGEELSVSRRGGFRRISVPEGSSVEQALEFYRNNPEVEYAEPNYIYHAYMTPNDPYYSYQWHFPSISMGPAWDESTGSGVLVGIIDTGVAYEDYGSYQQAPDLANTNFVAGYDFVNNDSHANDDQAHGTHVCGTVAQSTNNSLGVAGTAFNCTIMPIKVLDSNGSGYITDIADGIYYAADNGCQVINMSLGGSSGSTTLQNAVQYAYNAGVTIVCAAGNAGTSSPQYPAAYSECISVSAVRYDNTITGYSCYGSTIDICAPGGDVSVDQNGDGYGDGVLQQTFASGSPTSFGYYFYEGTSMASPHVAGVAAMVIAAAGGSMTPAEVRDVLESTATDLGASGWDQYYGYGKVNAYDAVLEAQGGGGNPPVADFTGSPTSGEEPLTVYFTDQSSNSPTSWSWDFGDGYTSTAQNPNHQYSSAGTYTVVLAATNQYGSDTETKVNYITVSEPGSPPVADFTGSPTSGEVPLTVYFTDQSSNSPTSWNWDFGDGYTSTAQNPSHPYSSAGTYTVVLTATNQYGSDTETKADYITVTEPPQYSMHVSSIDVWRQSWWFFRRGAARITIVDQNNNPVSGATVYGDFTGPTSGSRNGSTDSNGQVTLYSSYAWSASGEWCFEVANVTRSGWTYNAAANEVTKSCESGDVFKVSKEEMFAGKEMPKIYQLFQNYPNPFNPVTRIGFSMPESGYVTLSIYNVKGELVEKLVDRNLEAGIHDFEWNARGVASGVYFYRLKTEGFVQTRKMILMR